MEEDNELFAYSESHFFVCHARNYMRLAWLLVQGNNPPRPRPTDAG
jgi:hypothetical protein